MDVTTSREQVLPDTIQGRYKAFETHASKILQATIPGVLADVVEVL